jgi:hypothetical protein
MLPWYALIVVNRFWGAVAGVSKTITKKSSTYSQAITGESSAAIFYWVQKLIISQISY